MDDDRLLADLGRIAAGFGGTWMANISAIRLPDESHVIFELVPRPTVWHAYLDDLGYPTLRCLRAIATDIPVDLGLDPDDSRIELMQSIGCQCSPHRGSWPLPSSARRL